MQLPTIIRGGAASKLDKANGELAKCEASIIELRARLSGLDPESDDYAATAQALNAQINVQEKALAILSLQCAGLEAKVAQEEDRERERRRQVAVTKVEKMLPQYIKAVEDYAAALLGPHAMRAALIEARKLIAKQWPIEALEYPFSFYFDTGRADRALTASIAADDGTAQEIAKDFVAHEVKMLADLVVGLKNPPAPAENEEAA